jgi:hypothetical protein
MDVGERTTCERAATGRPFPMHRGYAASSCDVQLGQRVALMGMLL